MHIASFMLNIVYAQNLKAIVKTDHFNSPNIKGNVLTKKA